MTNIFINIKKNNMKTQTKIKEFKIKLWLSDGTSRDKSDVLEIILKRMKLTKFLEWNVILTYEESNLYDKIESQINQQYDCNKREITFKIEI